MSISPLRMLVAAAVFLAGGARAFAGEPVSAAGQAAAGEASSGASGGETTVVGARILSEHDSVGDAHQPRWTDRRRFPGVRLYVAPAGAATFEFWLEGKVTGAGNPTRLRSMYEMSFGLGHRLQLDLYVRTESSGPSPMAVESERLELRYALADWGELWGNPTLYLEYIRQTDGPSKAEGKLLLGGEATRGLFWGVNLFWETELWGPDMGHEYGAVAGLTWSLLDSRLSLGAETRLEVVDSRQSGRVPLEVEWLVGPSVSYRPVPQAHVLFTAYAGPGLSRQSPGADFSTTWVLQPTLVSGWRF